MIENLHNPQISQPTGSKPVKLRSACNCCFTAKVRCDGNKSGCKRCADKNLTCVYSISRVGKVVGKRRKKPLPDVKAEEMTTARIHSPFVMHTASLSPASTQVSDDFSRASCATTGWDSFVPFNTAAADNSDLVYGSDAINSSTFSMSENIHFTMQHGLPTPSLSPPCLKRLSTNHLDINGPVPATITLAPSMSGVTESHRVQTPDMWAPTQQEDDETVCIKLLAHLKRHTLRTQVSHEATLTLIRKTNAALRRILQSEYNRSDPSCRLLLSSISVQLARLCEILAQIQRARTPSIQPMKSLESEFIHDAYLEDGQQDNCPQSTGIATVQDPSQSAIQDSLASNVTIGNLLKRKPSHGFQALGRQESLHIELDMRMKKALLTLS